MNEPGHYRGPLCISGSGWCAEGDSPIGHSPHTRTLPELRQTFIRTRDNTPIRSPWGGKRQPLPKCREIFIRLSGPLRKTNPMHWAPTVKV